MTHDPTRADIEAAAKMAGSRQWDYVKQAKLGGQWTDETVTPIEVLAWHEEKAIIIMGGHVINVPYGEQWSEPPNSSISYRRVIRERKRA